jgi:hypothetical protein
MIGMITPESLSKLLGILGDKEKCIESDEFIYSKKTYGNFRTDAIHFPLEARKETHEQRKTKINIDEFRSRTTNITHSVLRTPYHPAPTGRWGHFSSPKPLVKNTNGHVCHALLLVPIICQGITVCHAFLPYLAISRQIAKFSCFHFFR